MLSCFLSTRIRNSTQLHCLIEPRYLAGAGKRERNAAPATVRVREEELRLAGDQRVPAGAERAPAPGREDDGQPDGGHGACGHHHERRCPAPRASEHAAAADAAHGGGERCHRAGEPGGGGRHSRVHRDRLHGAGADPARLHDGASGAHPGGLVAGGRPPPGAVGLLSDPESAYDYTERAGPPLEATVVARKEPSGSTRVAPRRLAWSGAVGKGIASEWMCAGSYELYLRSKYKLEVHTDQMNVIGVDEFCEQKVCRCVRTFTLGLCLRNLLSLQVLFLFTFLVGACRATVLSTDKKQKGDLQYVSLESLETIDR